MNTPLTPTPTFDEFKVLIAERFMSVSEIPILYEQLLVYEMNGMDVAGFLASSKRKPFVAGYYHFLLKLVDTLNRTVDKSDDDVQKIHAITRTKTWQLYRYCSETSSIMSY